MTHHHARVVEERTLTRAKTKRKKHLSTDSVLKGYVQRQQLHDQLEMSNMVCVCVCVWKKAGGRAKQSSSLDKKGHILTNAIKKNQDFNKRFSITLNLFIQRNNKTFRQLFLWIMSSSKQKCLTMSQFSFVDVSYLSCRIENIREMYYRFEGWIRRLKALGNCDISDNSINLLKNLIIIEKNVVAKLWIHLHYPASKLVRICYFSLIYMTNIKSVGVWTVDLNTLPWAL